MKFKLIFLVAFPLCACASNKAIDVHVNEHIGAINFVKEKFPLDDKEALNRLNTAMWINEYALVHGDKTRTAKSCKQLIEALDNGFKSTNYRRQVSLIAKGMYCRLSRLTTTLKPSRVSYIDNNLATVDFAKAAPPQLAMVISKDDQRKLAKAISWFEMDNIKRVTTDNHQMRFYDSSGGIHTLSIIAKGDFNNDGIEDVVISKFNTVKGGSYASSHGYVLTRLTSDGRYKLIKEI